MKCFRQARMALSWLVVTGVLIGSSTVSTALAQSSNDTKFVEALEAANANGTQGFAAIGGKIIIVIACPQGATSTNQCDFYNTQLIPNAAQSSIDMRLVEALEAANANGTQGMAAIGGKNIIVGACATPTTPLPECDLYSTRLIPAG